MEHDRHSMICTALMLALILGFIGISNSHSAPDGVNAGVKVNQAQSK